MKRICYLLLVTQCAVAQNTLTIQAGAVIKTTGGAVINLQNLDLQNNGIISQAPGEGKFLFTGTADNTISGSSAPLFDILQIAKNGNSKLTLQSNINVGSTLGFTSGLIDLNGHHIQLQPAAVLNGESETSRIIGTNGGYIEIDQSLNAPAAANPGNLGAIISAGANMGNTTIRRSHQSQMNAWGAGNSVLRSYHIMPANNTALNATLRFQYFDAELNSLAENDLVLWKSPDSIHWSSHGFTGRDMNINYVEQAGIANFSRWTLSSTSNALPLIWGSFHTICANNTVVISWKTMQESNTQFFFVQRSGNGSQWATIATLSAAGNSNTMLNYSFTDTETGNFYRIIQTDMDGRETQSPVLRNQCNGNEIFRVYPNPISTETVIILYAAHNETVVLQVFDSKGALIKQQKESMLRGMNQLTMNLASLPAGTYYLLASWPGGKQKTAKLEKQ